MITREDDYQDLRDPRPTLIKPPKGAHAPRFLIRALTSPLGSNALQQGVDTAKGQETCDVGGKRTLGNGQQMIWQVPNIPPNAFLGIEQQTFDGSRGKRGTGDRHRRSREQLLRTEPTQDHFLDEGILGGYKVPPKRVRHDPGRGPKPSRRTHTGGRGGLHSPSNCQPLPSGRADYRIKPIWEAQRGQANWATTTETDGAMTEVDLGDGATLSEQLHGTLAGGTSLKGPLISNVTLGWEDAEHVRQSEDEGFRRLLNVDARTGPSFPIHRVASRATRRFVRERYTPGDAWRKREASAAWRAFRLERIEARSKGSARLNLRPSDVRMAILAASIIFADFRAREAGGAAVAVEGTRDEVTDVAVNNYYRTNSAMRPARSLNVCSITSQLIGAFMPDNLLDLPLQHLARRGALSIYRILVHHVAIPAARYPHLFCQDC